MNKEKGNMKKVGGICVYGYVCRQFGECKQWTSLSSLSKALSKGLKMGLGGGNNRRFGIPH